MARRVVIAGLSACTPVGRDAWSSAAAVRAGISGFNEHPYMIDSAGEPMRVAIAPWLDVSIRGADRLEALLTPALEDVLHPLLATAREPLKVGLALGLPSPRPGLASDIEHEMLKRVFERHSPRFDALLPFACGHASGLLGLRAAYWELQQGRLDACVVAGVDSYIDPETLNWVEQCEQLHGAGGLNNAWGFVPGEASSAVLVLLEDVARACRLAPLALVLGVGVANEPMRIKSETVCTGEGLTQAVRMALGALPDGHRVSDVYCDMNGEPYRADEYGFAYLRTKEFFLEASTFVAPADCWGDVGAAGGSLHLMLACIGGLKGYANGKLSLVWSSSEPGERAAALIATLSGE